jgi:hypothetical protein
MKQIFIIAVIMALLVGLSAAAGPLDPNQQTNWTKTITGGSTWTGTVQAAHFVSTGSSNIKGALTTTTTAKIGGTGTLNALVDNTTAIIAGRSYLNATQATNIYASGTIGAGGASNFNDTTIASTKMLAVTTADKLTVGGVIVPQAITITVPLNANSVNGSVYIPISGNYALNGMSISYNVNSSGAGAGTVTLVKCTAGQNPASAGVAMLSVAPSIKGTPNTIIPGTVSTVDGRAKVNTTEFMGMRFNTALTGLAGGCVSISVKRIA